MSGARNPPLLNHSRSHLTATTGTAADGGFQLPTSSILVVSGPVQYLNDTEALEKVLLRGRSSRNGPLMTSTATDDSSKAAAAEDIAKFQPLQNWLKSLSVSPATMEKVRLLV